MSGFRTCDRFAVSGYTAHGPQVIRCGPDGPCCTVDEYATDDVARRVARRMTRDLHQRRRAVKALRRALRACAAAELEVRTLLAPTDAPKDAQVACVDAHAKILQASGILGVSKSVCGW